jgi:hypothetical protein
MEQAGLCGAASGPSYQHAEQVSDAMPILLPLSQKDRQTRQGMTTTPPKPRERAEAHCLDSTSLFFCKPVSCLPFGFFNHTGRGRPLGFSPHTPARKWSLSATPKPSFLPLRQSGQTAWTQALSRLPPGSRRGPPCPARLSLAAQGLQRWPARGVAGSKKIPALPTGSRSPRSGKGRPAPARPEGPECSPGRRGPARSPHRPPCPELTPVPLSHTTTFLPWLSIVRPGKSRRRRTTHSHRHPALCRFLLLPLRGPSLGPTFSLDRKLPPGPARHLADNLSGRGGTEGRSRDWQR